MINISFGILSYILTSFYALSFQDTDGNTVNMSSFQGKKVLICNIATGSNKAIQLAGLQQLQQQFGDSLAVIVFPSNSFGTESRTNAEIKQYCNTNYNSTFIIASKTNVTGSGTNSIFTWLAHKMQNGQMNAVTGADFLKFLIDKDGTLIGMFSSKVSPTDPEIIEGITTSF
jgi:glutathione peroxidase